jgi:hypothetical protein
LMRLPLGGKAGRTQASYLNKLTVYTFQIREWQDLCPIHPIKNSNYKISHESSER